MVKKTWITEYDPYLFTITFESSGIEAHEKAIVTEIEFPDRKDTTKKRHTVCIGILSEETLRELRSEIDAKLME